MEDNHTNGFIAATKCPTEDKSPALNGLRRYHQEREYKSTQYPQLSLQVAQSYWALDDIMFCYI